MEKETQTFDLWVIVKINIQTEIVGEILEAPLSLDDLCIFSQWLLSHTVFFLCSGAVPRERGSNPSSTAVADPQLLQQGRYHLQSKSAEKSMSSLR